LLLGPGKDAGNKVYVVDLPAEAPIVVQTDQFLGMLATIQTMHPGENLVIVGHSAGGVVARTALVRGGIQNVKALITIASPHVGTTRANQAIAATDESGIFGPVKSFFGGSGYDTLRRSRGLLFDLAYPQPGSLLYWLNAQQHPDIKYVSVVRLNPVGFAGDELVPGYSQDMNNVPTIQGKSSVIVTPAGHTLVAEDAGTLLQILNQLEDSGSKEAEPVS
jgi:pimeloyl-ACP methyl ester carboxylesterase